MDADGGKVHGKAAFELNTSFDGLDELRHIGVAWIEAGVCVYDSNDWPTQSIFAVAHYFDQTRSL